MTQINTTIATSNVPAMPAMPAFVAHTIASSNLTYFRNVAGQADILASDANAVIVPVNGVGAVFSFPATVFKRYPEALDQYLTAIDEGWLTRGKVLPVLVENGTRVLFLLCIRGLANRQPRLENIVEGLDTIRSMIEWGDCGIDVTKVATIKLGCGKTQLDWNLVGRVLAHELGQFHIPVEVYGLKKEESEFFLDKQTDAVEEWSLAQVKDDLRIQRMDRAAKRKAAQEVEEAVVVAPEPVEAVIVPIQAVIAPVRKGRQSKKTRKPVSDVREEPALTFTDILA